MKEGEVIKVKRNIWGSGGPYRITKYFGIGGEGETGLVQAHIGGRTTTAFAKELNFITPAAAKGPELKAFEQQQSEIFEAFKGLVGSTFVCKPLQFFLAERPQRYYQILEYYPGDDLDHYFAGAGIQPADRIWLARMIADGLAGIHERGLAMIDLKPGNIFVLQDKNPQGRTIRVPRIIDMTSAWKPGFPGAGAPGKTSAIPRGMPPMRLVFTEEWRSPEVYFFEKWLAKNPSKRPADNAGAFPGQPSDVFITARILYELLTGHPPIGDKSPRSRREFVAKVWNTRGLSIPNPSSAGASQVSSHQGDVVIRALSRLPKDRPTMRELHRALIGTAPVPPTTVTSGTVTLIKAGKRLQKSPGVIVLNQAGLAPLEIPWTQNMGMLNFYQGKGWALKFAPPALQAGAALNGTPVKDAALIYSLGRGRNVLRIGLTEIDVTVD